MCVNYIDLNPAFSKDSYPLPNINKFIYSSANYKLLSFMDVYSDSSQILVYEEDKEKIDFMTE